MKRLALVFATTFLTAFFANAEYKEVEQCGSFKIISGQSCSELKVEFSFKGCHLKSAPIEAKSVKCDGKSAVARLGKDGHRYQATLSVGENDWGEKAWKAEGKLKQWVETSILEAKNKTAQADAPTRNIASSHGSKSHTEISGFVGARHAYIKNDNTDSGHQIFDGAVYFAHKTDKASLNIDIPFARAGSTDANLNLGQGQAQAYITYGVSDFEFTFGQFDTLFGFELNDAVDRTFTDPGIVFNNTLPTLHTGLVAAYSSGPLTAKLLAANNRDKGAHNDEAPEYGIQVGYSPGDIFYITVGYLAHSEAGNTKSLTDVLIGTKIGPISVDLQYDIVTDDPNNPDSSATGIMLHAGWQTSEKCALALRLESVEKFAGAFKQTQASIGTNYSLNDNTRLQIDYSWSENEATQGAAKTEAQSGNIAAIYSFD